MRHPLFVPFAIAIALGGTIIGCGGDGGTRPPPAGRQPLPSSEPVAARPAASGSSAPMFRGPPRAELERVARGGGMISKMVREDRQRYEREHAGPQRMGEGGDGLVQAQAMVQGLTAGEGPCEEAWQARVTAAEQNHLPSPGNERDRREFLDRCRDLPEAQQRCMSPLYVQQHAEECGEIMGTVSRRMRRETGFDLERGEAPRSGAQPRGDGHPD